jgi:hypothetical protein
MFEVITTTEIELTFESLRDCNDDIIVRQFIIEIKKILSDMTFNDIHNLFKEDYDENTKTLHISFEYNYSSFSLYITYKQNDGENKLISTIFYYEDKLLKQLYVENNKHNHNFDEFKNVGEIIKNDLIILVNEINNEILEELQRDCHIEYARDLL